MHTNPIQHSDTWYLSVIEFLKSKNSGNINCRSRLEPRYAVCDEIEHIVMHKHHECQCQGNCICAERQKPTA